MNLDCFRPAAPGGRVHRSCRELLSTGLTDGGERIADLRLGDLLLGRGVLPSSLARQIGELDQANERALLIEDREPANTSLTHPLLGVCQGVS